MPKLTDTQLVAFVSLRNKKEQEHEKSTLDH